MIRTEWADVLQSTVGWQEGAALPSVITTVINVLLAIYVETVCSKVGLKSCNPPSLAPFQRQLKCGVTSYFQLRPMHTHNVLYPLAK